MSDNTDKDKPTDEIEKVREFMKSIESFYEYFGDHIYRARNILTFLYVDQWDNSVRQNRENLNKPTLSFNKLVPLVRAICGEQRENTPALAVRDVTVDFTVPQQQIDDFTDLVREISDYSSADVIYQIAFKQMLECGWGSARVCTKYEDANSFHQIIYIEPIVDFQSAFWDPLAQNPDKSDGDFCGVYQIVSREKFKRDYPDIEIPESVMPNSMQYFLPWDSQDAIIEGELYQKEFFTKTICELSNGKTLPKKEADELIALQEKALAEKPHLHLLGYQEITIENTRKVRDYKIRHYKFIQNKILEETVYPGKILPIPYAEGDSTVIDGRRIPLPYVQEAIDTQKMINYIGSEIASAILRSRKETVIGIAQNFEDNPDEWRNPDQVQGALTYAPGPNGERPEFITAPVFSESLMAAYQNSNNDLQSVTGRYDEANGRETNAQSGSAIAQRRNASSKPVKVYTDNLARFIRQIGLIIMDLVPHIYDGKDRTVVVRGADGATRKVVLNQRKGMKYNAMGDMEDEISNDVSKGKYDIEVRVDGSFDAQRAAALDFLLRYGAVNPNAVNLIGDMVAENSGLESASKLIKRLETLLPPAILAQEKGLPPPPPSPPPPPPPQLIIEQMKMETAKGDQQVAQAKQAAEMAKIQMDGQAMGLDYQAAYTKSMAEIIKSHNSVKEAALDHDAKVTTAHNGLTQKIIDAETKRVALDAQSRTLRGMNI